MKSDALTKTYEGMTSKQLATLAYIHNAKGNDLEVRRIFDAVPRKSYTMPDIEFSKHERALTVMGLCWACAYAQTRGRYAAVLGGVCVYGKQGDYEEMDRGIDTLTKISGEILGLMSALETICDEYGIDLQAVLKVTSISDYDDKPRGEIDQKTAEEMIEGMRGLLG